MKQLALATAIIGSLAGAAWAQDPDANYLYDLGTDAGMHYLSEYSGRLRTAILVRECGFTSLWHALRETLPQAMDYALEFDPILDFSEGFQLVSALVARSYVLGYETGVATELTRLPENLRSVMCEASAAASGQFLAGPTTATNP